MRVSSLVPWVAVAALAAGCGSDSESSADPAPLTEPVVTTAPPRLVSPSSGPPPTTVPAPVGSSVLSLPPATIDGRGDAATWRLESAAEVTATTTEFTALVSRLGCNGGVTGEVFDPIVEVDGTDIVVTFFVAPVDGDRTCPGNDDVPFEVTLGEPVGDRRLLDGACRSGAEASTTAWCAAGAARWVP